MQLVKISISSTQNIVEASGSYCLEKYGEERQQQWERSLWEEEDEDDFVWEDMMEEEDEERKMENIYETEDNAFMKVIV